MIKAVRKQYITNISEYFSQLGRKGGLKSRRNLSSQTARDMTRIRDARRAFKKYYAQCFWSYDPNYVVQISDIAWVSEQLKKNGNRKLWLMGVKLCR